jgi:hypothetical protein
VSKKDKGRLPPFVPLQHDMMDCPAWRMTSHGAKYLYIALKRRASYAGNRSFLAYRLARQELKASPQKIKEWYAELQHYGFIELAQHGCLGVDGKGKAPHWRLTEKGNPGQDVFPTKEFLRWDGVLFDPKPYRRVTGWDSAKLQKRIPVIPEENTPLSPRRTPPLRTRSAPAAGSVTHGVHIERDEGVTHVDNVTKLTTRGHPEGLSPTSGTPSKPSVAQTDPRLQTTSLRRRQRDA